MIFILDPIRTVVTALVINGITVLLICVVYKTLARRIKYIKHKVKERSSQHEELKSQPTGSDREEY